MCEGLGLTNESIIDKIYDISIAHNEYTRMKQEIDLHHMVTVLYTISDIMYYQSIQQTSNRININGIYDIFPKYISKNQNLKIFYSLFYEVYTFINCTF